MGNEITADMIAEVSKVFQEAEVPPGPRHMWITDEQYQTLPEELKADCSNENCDGGYILTINGD